MTPAELRVVVETFLVQDGGYDGQHVDAALLYRVLEHACDVEGYQSRNWRDPQTGQVVRRFRRGDIDRVIDLFLSLAPVEGPAS